MATLAHRGGIVRRELRSIANRSRLSFRRVEATVGDEFQQSLSERHSVFCSRVVSLTSIFEAVVKVLKAWRRDVFVGLAEFDPDEEAEIKALFQEWRETAIEFSERAEFFGRHKLPVVEGVALSIAIEEAGEVLAKWTRPYLSISPSLRVKNPAVTEPEQYAS